MATSEVNYFINGVSPHYSTTEQKVGEWIDGSPLYQKTVDCGALPSSASSKNVAHGVSNMDCIYSIVGIAINTTSFGARPLQLNSSSSLASNVTIKVDKTNIILAAGQDQSAYNKTYVTIQYTKTS